MNEVKLRMLRSVGSAASDAPAELLMHRASGGDQQAFAELYDELAPVVHGVVLRVLRDPAMSAEVTQEVFVEMWRLAARFDSSRSGVQGWAATIAHRRAVDRVRSEQARRDREERDHQQSHETPADVVSESIDRASDRSQVRAALDELPATQREAVTLAYYEGHTYREVAALLEVPEGTIKTRIRDGLVKLRDKIGEPA